AWRHPQFGG
nr:Chain P, STREP-TAG PEPTIDE